ncbi:FHA domain-containing protein [Tautonia sociabilis]|uniref:FHA domain-containing protein n=1 Tax=Tautonia sociabilis TaxID=2080755 RepID=UPI00131548A0|nr:FHA domain-containing protein [Tautonia sociabilis]
MIDPQGDRTLVIVDRPYATIGRVATADVPVPSPSAAVRHVYLHLDRRGAFAVDLVSRTGTRFDDAPEGARACWLRPGRGLELAGHRVELIEADPVDGPGDRLPGANPLAEADGLPPLDLLAEGDPDRPLTLLSELSFLGRSPRCAIQADGDGVARVHAVVVRSARGIFLVNLGGPALTVNDRPASPAGPIRDGDRIALGRSRFEARLRADLRPASPSPTPSLGRISPTTALAAARPPEGDEGAVSRALRAVQNGQEELLRSNEQFQRALVSVVRRLYEEQAALFDRHLERLDRLQAEVAELREELRRRLPPGAALPPSRRPPGPPDPPPIAPKTPPGTDSPTEPGRATTWLLDRLGELEDQLDREARSGWRDLFSRLGPASRPPGRP